MALPFVACNKEELTEPVSKGEQISISVKATAEDLANLTDTKTYIDGMNVLWGENEQMSIFLINGNTAASATSTDFTGEGKAEAMFAFNFNSEDIPANGPYTYGGVYPASADKGLTKGQTTDKVELPATQNATATSYDPAAYIMVAKPESFETVQTEWIASYRRATALNKITLTGISEDIASVAITVPEGKYLAGRRYIDVATGESGEIYDSGYQTNTITVNYATALPHTAADVWFTSWGVEVAEGEAVTVKVTTVTNKAYTKTFNARAEGIKFTENYLNTLAVDMSDAIAEETGLPLPFTEDFSEVEKGSISTPNDKLASLSAFDISGDVYQAGGAIRLGKDSAVGTITTKSALDLSEPFTIIVFGTGWDDNEHVLNITAGSQVKSITFTTDKNGGAYEPQYVYFNAETNMTKVSFSNKTGERVLLDNIEIVSGEWIPTPEISSVETISAQTAGNIAILNGAYSGVWLDDATIVCGFEYGTDASNLTSVTASNISAGEFSFQLSDLTLGETYIYKAWVQLYDGEKIYGETKTFELIAGKLVYTLTLTGNDFVNKGGYEPNNGSHTFTAYAADGSSTDISIVTEQIMRGSANNIQVQSQGRGYLYNETPFASVESIRFNSLTGGSFTVMVGNEQNPTSGTEVIGNNNVFTPEGDVNYFVAKSGSATTYCSEIVITFTME